MARQPTPFSKIPSGDATIDRLQDRIAESSRSVTTVLQGLKPSSWIPVSFAGTFANYTGVAGFAACAFQRNAIGEVRLKGFTTGGTSGGVICTLPAGYRPRETHQFAQQQFNGAGVSSHAVLQVNPDGTVVATVYTPAAGSNLTLDCSFVGEQ